MKPYTVVLTTLSTRAQGRRIAGLLLKKRLAACINLIGPIRSSFWWQGKIDHAREYLLLLKTRSSQFPRLCKFLEKNHPYSVPEILALPVEKGNASYLKWIRETVRN